MSLKKGMLNQILSEPVETQVRSDKNTEIEIGDNGNPQKLDRIQKGSLYFNESSFHKNEIVFSFYISFEHLEILNNTFTEGKIFVGGVMIYPQKRDIWISAEQLRLVYDQ